MGVDKRHFVVATAIIFNNEGKMLIAKRSEKERVFPGRWTVPGGKLSQEDYSEIERNNAGLRYHVIEQTLNREVEEEVGLKIGEIKYLTSITHMTDDGIPSIYLSFFCDHLDGEVKLCEELEDFAWVSLEEAKNYDLIDGIYDELVWASKAFKG